MEKEMTYKKCSKCGEEKPLTSEYYVKDKTKKTGFRSSCKICSRLEQKKSKQKKIDNNFKIDITEKKCKTCNIVKPVSEFGKQITTKDGYRPNCILCRRENGTKYRYKLKEEGSYIIPETKVCPKCNIEKDIDDFYRNDYRIDRRRQYCKECDYEDTLPRARKRRKVLYHTSPLHRLKKLYGGRVRKYLNRKTMPKDNILGCDWETFMEHLENQFTDGMSWDNMGKWELDHYYPQSIGKNDEEILLLNHYTNFQPLWAKDNNLKADKVPPGYDKWMNMMKEKIYGDTDN